MCGLFSPCLPELCHSLTVPSCQLLPYVGQPAAAPTTARQPASLSAIGCSRDTLLVLGGWDRKRGKRGGGTNTPDWQGLGNGHFGPLSISGVGVPVEVIADHS